jgi:hypothetical protein
MTGGGAIVNRFAAVAAAVVPQFNGILSIQTILGRMVWLRENMFYAQVF